MSDYRILSENHFVTDDCLKLKITEKLKIIKFYLQIRFQTDCRIPFI